MKSSSNNYTLSDILRFSVITTAFLAVVILFSSCAPDPVGPRKATNWAYAPASISIHPLSRFKKPSSTNENLLIVVHVELNDGDGFACRGVGKLLITITSDQDIQLGFELIDLEDVDENRLRFDDVTRTYLIRFSEIPEQVDSVKIRASFTAENEDTLKSSPRTIVKHVN